MGIIILGIAVAFRKQFDLPNKSEWGYFAMLGFLGITFHQWLQSNGLQTSEASTTAWIIATTPVFMAVLGWVMLKEGLAFIKIIGIGLAALGVLLVVTDGNLTSISIGRFGAPGDILILISAFNWAVFSALSRRGLRIYSASLMIFYVMLAGWFFTSCCSLQGNIMVRYSSSHSTAGWVLPSLGSFVKGWLILLGTMHYRHFQLQRLACFFTSSLWLRWSLHFSY